MYVINDIEYEYYKIHRLEWTLDTDLLGVVVIYYDEQNPTGAHIKTHYFKVKNGEVDVNNIINELKRIHGRNVVD
jgi:hypothetical protein